MQIAKIYADEIEDRLLASFYIFGKISFGNMTTIGTEEEEITNGIDLRNFVKNGTPYIRISDIKRGQINFQTIEKVNTKLSEVPKKILLRKYDLLISRKGTPGIVSIATELEEECIIGTEVIKVRFKPNSKITPQVAFAFLNTKKGFAQFIGKLTGTVSRGINHRALRSIRLPILSENQQRIVSKLIDKAIENYTLSISKINQAREILEKELKINHDEINENKTYITFSNDLTDMFTPKFYYPKFLNTLKELRKRFETVKLGEIAEIIRGNEVGSKNYKSYLEKSENDVPFIRTSDLVNYEIDNYPDYYVDEEIYKELNQDLKERDLLVSTDGKIGLLAILTKWDKCIIQSHIRRVRFQDKINSYYALAFLSTRAGQFQFKQHSFTQATIPTMSNHLTDIEIPLLSEEKIKQISRLIKEAFQLKEGKKRLIMKAIKMVEDLI